MQPNASWHRVRDGLAVILSAGMVGALLYAGAGGISWGERSRLEAVEDNLRELQKQAQEGGPAASRQRLAAVEAQLAKLQSSTSAEAHAQSRQEMQRWLAQRTAQTPRETVAPASRKTFGLLVVMAVALFGLSVSRWFPARP